jgi:hypothetical protein
MKQLLNEWRKYLKENNISSQLKALSTKDQELRNIFSKWLDKAGGWSQELANKFAEKYNTKPDDLFNDHQTQQEFLSIFPDITEEDYASFTDEDWDSFHIIVQHMDNYIDIQKQVRDILQKYNRTSQFEYLDDRINCAEGRPQKYGTQNICGEEQS